MLSLDVKLQQGHFRLNVNFTLDQPVTGLFGSSGSGKTTLLNLIAGLGSPTSGWIKLDKQYLFHDSKKINLPPNKRNVGIVFQDSRLFPHLNVAQNLEYGYKHIDKKQRRFEIAEIVDLLEIGPLLSNRTTQLSGGEKQRIGLARTLLSSPQFLLLDEPLASLDQGLKGQILPFLKRVKDELALPMLYISHSMEEILHLTDYLVVIDNGCILGTGHFDHVIKNKNLQDLAHSVGLENVIKVNIIEHDFESGHTISKIQENTLLLPLAEKFSINDFCYISIRSNEIAIAKYLVAHISIQNQIKGKIIECIKQTTSVSIHVDIGTVLIVDITPKAFKELALHQGEYVYCLIKARSFSFLGKAD